MADELEMTFAEVNERNDATAVIVTGAVRAFCAGADLGAEGNAFGVDEGLSDTIMGIAEWVASVCPLAVGGDGRRM